MASKAISQLTAADALDGTELIPLVQGGETKQATIDDVASAVPAFSGNGDEITSGTVADARIASTIARDSEVTSAISTHAADTDPHGDRAYADAEIASAIASNLNYRGGYAADTNTPDLDTSPSGVQLGDLYAVTAAGTFFTAIVEVGDLLIAEIDDADAESEWTILQANISFTAAQILSLLLTVDGAGSGLDADLLDGQSSAAFATAGHNHTGTYQPLDAVLTATTASFLTADETKLDGIESGAEVNNISDANATDLTDGGDTTLHTHSAYEAANADLSYRVIRIVLDGGGSAITTGAKKVYVTVPFAGTITKARLLADQSGSIVVDVWKDSYANFPPTVADTITASAKPTLSTATKSEDSTLTGWTTTVAAGDVLEVNVDSAATVTKVFLDLFVTVT